MSHEALQAAWDAAYAAERTAFAAYVANQISWSTYLEVLRAENEAAAAVIPGARRHTLGFLKEVLTEQ
jgi:hypothetical protein